MTNTWAASFPLFAVDPWHLRGTCPRFLQILKFKNIFMTEFHKSYHESMMTDVAETHTGYGHQCVPSTFSATSKLRWCEYIIWPMGYNWNWYISFMGWTTSERHWTPPAFFLTVLEKKMMELWENSFPADSVIFQ